MERENKTKHWTWGQKAWVQGQNPPPANFVTGLVVGFCECHVAFIKGLSQEKIVLICFPEGWSRIILIIKNKWGWGTSLVIQWLRIHLPMQRTCVPSLIQEDPTCCRTAKPVKPMHSRACSLQEKSPQWEAHVPQLESGPGSPQLEKIYVQQQRPSTVKSK